LRISSSGCTTATLQRGECTVIVKEVPADVCEICGEYYLSEEVSAQLEKRADDAANGGQVNW
jgi:YgiT-type zinc finger domain-containing protein